MVTRTPGGARTGDPRPQRTRASILAAIERLDREGSALSVASVAAAAGISRTSFYAQFRDLDDVAVQLMRERYQEIKRVDAELRSDGSAADPTRETLSLLLEEFERHRALYAAVLGRPGSGDAHRELQEILVEGARATMLRVAPPHIVPEIAAKFVAAGILAIVVDALVSEDPSPLESLREQITDLLPVWVTTDSATSTWLGAPSSPPREGGTP